jgi:hypothetical protein
MTEPNPRDQRAVEEGAREAAGHVLAILDGAEPTHDFVRQLIEAAPVKQVAIVSSLVHIVSRTAVESADMATLKLKLRLMAKEPMPDEG